MRYGTTLRTVIFSVIAVLFTVSMSVPAIGQRGFTRLFDGKTLEGWTLVGQAGQGYIARDGILICPSDGGGTLMTDRDYSDFIFRFEFRLEKAGNNGLAIRAPLDGNSAYHGMELQILDNEDPMYASLHPAQYHGSIYMVAAAKRGALKKPGEWNQQEVTAIGRRIQVKLNGQIILDADLNKVNDPKTLAEHPGIFRDSGRIGFMGHGPSQVEFRNIFIRDLAKPEKDNTPPPGFTALFNGKDLTGWKALVGDPRSRAKMTPEQLAEAQKRADEAMRSHWIVDRGVIIYDGKNNSLCTVKDYRNFEMLVDWKIGPGGDSGIYLRGSPQVQIWDRPEGSGGLYNNEKNPRNPSKKADLPPGQWNRFRIVMLEDRVTIFLNGELVVHNVIMENYWERDKPIYPTGQIELQHHGDRLEFKNIYIREIP